MDFLQKAQNGKNHAWMYILMFFILLFGSILGQVPITLKAFFAADGDLQKFRQSAENSFTDLGIDTSLYLFLILFSFVVPLVLFVLALEGMHLNILIFLVTSLFFFFFMRFFFGVFVWGIITILVIGSDILFSPEKYLWNFKPFPFFTLCIVAILFMPLQTSLEEFLFRGYYMQGLALWIKNKWAPLLIMSVVFGLLHGMNPEIEKLGAIALVFYIGTGFFFGVITLMDDGIELAMGMHAINNILAALFVTTDWTVFQTDAMYVDLSEPSVGVDMFLPLFVLYPIVFFIFSKKYGWSNWKDKVFGPIVPQRTVESH